MFDPVRIEETMGILNNRYGLEIIAALTSPDVGVGKGLTSDLILEKVNGMSSDYTVKMAKSSLYRILVGLGSQGYVQVNKNEYSATKKTLKLVDILDKITYFASIYREDEIKKLLASQLKNPEALKNAVKAVIEAEKRGGTKAPEKENEGFITRPPFFSEIIDSIFLLAEKIQKDKYNIDLIVSVSSGGSLVGSMLARHMDIPQTQITRSHPKWEKTRSEESLILEMPNVKGKNVLLTEDICKGGSSLSRAKERCKLGEAKNIKTATLMLHIPDGWVAEDEKRADYWLLQSKSFLEMPWDVFSPEKVI